MKTILGDIMKHFLKALLGFFGTLLAVCLILILCLNSFLNNNLSKREIFRLVNNYSNTILIDIEENNFDNTRAIKGVTDIIYEEVVEVKCGGKGFASASSYYGFYYYDKDVPVVMFNGKISDSDTTNLLTDNKGYSFQEKNTDNKYYTEKISPCFYYYEWHF